MSLYRNGRSHRLSARDCSPFVVNAATIRRRFCVCRQQYRPTCTDTSTEDVLAEAPTDEMFDADAVILAQEDVADTDAVTNKVTNEVLEPNANALDLADVENTAEH